MLIWVLPALLFRALYILVESVLDNVGGNLGWNDTKPFFLSVPSAFILEGRALSRNNRLHQDFHCSQCPYHRFNTQMWVLLNMAPISTVPKHGQCLLFITRHFSPV
jgi:hypothetical protein